MSNKTVLNELNKSIKERIPSAATNESLLTLQSELGKLCYEIKRDWTEKEKQQLRDAFNKGVVYGMLLASTKHDQSDNYKGFDQYFKDQYGDEA